MLERSLLAMETEHVSFITTPILLSQFKQEFEKIP